MNFHDTPTRRIELKLSVTPDSDLEYTKDLVVSLLSEDDRVLEEPAPPVVFIMSANAYSVDMTAYCWVLNENWLGGRSDLWLKLMNAFGSDARISLAIPEQKIVVSEQNSARG